MKKKSKNQQNGDCMDTVWPLFDQMVTYRVLVRCVHFIGSFRFIWAQKLENRVAQNNSINLEKNSQKKKIKSAK